MIAPPPPEPVSIDVAECRPYDAPEYLSLGAEAGLQIPEVFSLPFAYKKKILQIEPGKLQLRLTQIPQIIVDPETLNCEVAGWGVKMSALHVESLPQALARRFLVLFSKADSGSLSEDERRCWLSVLDQVDYQTFCIDRAAPHYVEGIIVTKHQGFILVEWHDETREKLDRLTARPLEILESGDQFGAWVKLGRDSKAKNIENVTILESNSSASS